MYKTVVIEYSPKSDDMAKKVERKANEMLKEGYELVTMSITTTAKAILVFKKYLFNNNYKIDLKGNYNMKFNSLIPEFSVSNIKNSIKFYTDIGFEIIYERKDDKFCFLQLEKNQIMLEQINDNWNTGILEYPFGRGINISMSLENIDKYYKEIIEKGIVVFQKIKVNKYQVNNRIYEDKEFLIQDPDGYLLRFNN